MADVTERIEKQMEGTNLALAAVAEVLQKMDDRLSKEESYALELAQEEASDVAKEDLVKSIAGEVLNVLKDELAGLDVSGDTRSADSVGTSADADDSSENVDITTDIEEQQNTIQASLQKEKDDDDDDKEKMGMAYKQDDDDEDEAADVPEEEDESEEMKSMKKQISALEKALTDSKGIAEERLRKMGFSEQTSLKAPKISAGLGVDTTPLVKSDNGDVADQLTSLSYKELRDLQHNIQTGNTDGVPRELLG
tara:strand:+ start:602 stop:1357 length:756 start_codon:yes stop_codon:yes gene_type:complete